MELLVHEDTKKDVDRLVQKPSHAVIIEGKLGAGKRSLANQLVADLLNVPISNLDSYQYLLAIEPTNSSISIDQVRQVQQFLKLKTLGRSNIRRAVIIEQAELLTIEAQNAFLKVLEEPPADTIILLLTNQKNKLLPTIVSRVQQLSVKKVAKPDIEVFFKSMGHTDQTITAAYYTSNGQVGLMSSLLNDESSQRLDYIKLAKQLLTQNAFERLSQVDGLAKQREALPDIVQALITISRAGLQTTVAKDDLKQAKRWHKCLELSLKTERQLASNPNSKLLLTNLLLNL